MAHSSELHQESKQVLCHITNMLITRCFIFGGRRHLRNMYKDPTSDWRRHSDTSRNTVTERWPHRWWQRPPKTAIMIASN